jgi:hypothetical protein
MHCGVMVTGYNQGDWGRLLAEDYSRPQECWSLDHLICL